jgi:hypothetical protein
MEEGFRSFSVSLDDKKVEDRRLRSNLFPIRCTLIASKSGQSKSTHSFSDRLEKTLANKMGDTKVTNHKKLEQSSFKKGAIQSSLPESKRYLEESNLKTKAAYLFLPSSIQEFFQESFLLNTSKESAFISQVCDFFDSLIGHLNFTSKENAALLGFCTLNSTIRIFTNIWHMEIVLSSNGMIQDVKILTSNKDFFDQCSKTMSKFKQMMSEYDWLDEVNFTVSLDSKLSSTDSKVLRSKLSGSSNIHSDVHEVICEQNSEELNLLI